MTEKALFQEALPHGAVRCLLCPRGCVIPEGKTGFCRVRLNKGGVLQALTAHTITAAAYDPTEKKPFARFYPGRLIFSIGNFGCNFCCDYCQNHAIVYDPATVQGISSDEAILDAAAAHDSAGIAFTYNEPTIAYELVLRLSRKAKEKGLAVAVVSNGFINEAPLKELLPYTDAWNIDLKMGRDDRYRTICGGTMEDVLRSIRLVYEGGKHVEVTCLLIPTLNTDDDSLTAMAKSIASVSPDIPVHLSRYFPAFRRTTPPTPLSAMARGEAIFRKYVHKVHLGNMPA